MLDIRSIKKASPLHLNIIIALAAAMLFIPFLGQVHLFDWDENNFAEAAREMLVTGEWLKVQINFEPFYEKPPLFFWLQALSMKLFGINEFAARLPNAICGIATLLILFNIGRKIYDNIFGLLWVMAYVGSFLPHFYFKSGIIDPVFNLFIFLGIYFLIRNTIGEAYPIYSNKKYRYRNVVYSGIFLGLAILTKGPVGILIPFLVLVIFSGLYLFKNIVRWQEFILWGVSTLLVSLLWFGVEWIRSGPEFITAFTIRQWELLTTGDAGHGQPFYYHFIVILAGCFPASILMIKGHRRIMTDTAAQNRFHQWMVILFWVVLILFSLVKTKIIHYSSMTYIPLTYLAAHYLYALKLNEQKWNRILTGVLGFFVLLFSAAFILLPVIGKNMDALIPLINDPFAVANFQAAVSWQGWEIAIGAIYLAIGIAGLALIVFYNYIRGAMALFVATIVAIQLLLPIIVPKVEHYTQGAAIEFYKEKGQEDAYLQVLGFRSYGFLFYGRTTETMDLDHLLTGDINKPAYFVVKNVHAEQYKTRYGLEKVGEKNGYVFLLRKP